MQDHNQPFNSLMLVVGIIIGLIAGLALLVSINSLDARGALDLDDPAVQAEIVARLQPVGRVVPAGAEELAAAARPARAAAPAAPRTGNAVFQQACSACHAAAAPDVLGAPKIDDAAAWAPRIAQGMAVLRQNAIDGVQGDSGAMPARGGCLDCSDDEIVAAIEYMVEQASTR